jgi:hypothetical protein
MRFSNKIIISNLKCKHFENNGWRRKQKFQTNELGHRVN